MTEEQQETVVKFYQNGGLIRMRSHGYVDDFASIDKEEGEWKIYSEVWARRSLLGYSFDELSFFKRVTLE